MSSDLKVSFTKYVSAAGFGKSVSLDPVTGGLIKGVVANMSAGRFETVDLDWSDFGSYLAGLTPGESLGYGVCCKKTNLDGTGDFLRGGKIVAERFEAGKLHCASKTRKNFSWHRSPCERGNILMLDLDDLQGVDSIDENVARIFKLFPALGRLPGGCFAYASAGANIEKVGEASTESKILVGLKGLHVYFYVPNIITIDEIVTYLKTTAWLNGSMHWKVNVHDSGCSLLERGPVDFSVFTPERIDFIGGTLCKEGVIQRREVPTHFIDSELISSLGSETLASAFSISAEEKALAAELQSAAQIEGKKISEPLNDEIKGRFVIKNPWVNKKSFDFLDKDELPGLFEIKMDSGEMVPVWRLIFFPEKYKGMSCYDPLELEKGRQKACFFYNGSDTDRANRFIIGSFVHGGVNYRLVTELDGVREMLKKTASDEIKARLEAGDGNWWRELMTLDSVLELPEILGILKERKIMDKGESYSKIGAEIVPALAVEKWDALSLMNEKYAYVCIGGKARYVEDNGRGLILRSKLDFLADVENLRPIARWNGSKTVYDSAGAAWLAWEGRRGYPGGLRFEPGVPDREFEDPDGSGLVLNRYRGLAVVPTLSADFKCGRAVCEGRGCFEYFFSEIAKVDSLVDNTSAVDLNFVVDLNIQPGVCSCKGTWTRWLRTIYDVVCEGNLEHTRWVLDWFCDIIQAPGGRKGKGLNGADLRSGVSLVVRGGQGTGKDSIVEPIMRILGQYAITLTDLQQVSRNFNSFLEDCLLVFGNEILWGGEKRAGNKLKDIITGDSIRIEPKGLDSYQAKNFVRLFAASNSDWVIPAEEDERRYTVFNVGNKYCKNREWFSAMKAGNLSELLELILNWKIKSNVNINLVTNALEEQKELGYSTNSVEAFLEIAIEQNWFWDAAGLGLSVTHDEIELKFAERIKRSGQYSDSPEVFKRKLRKWLKDRGASIVGKVSVGNNRKANGFRFPTLEWVINQTPRLRKIYDENISEEIEI